MLSIVTVTRNNAAGLAATLHSLAKQRSPGHYELLLLDGASTDGSQKLVEDYLDVLPIRYMSEADDGIYDAMNKSLAHARGDYVQWLNAGDVLADDDSLNIMNQALEAEAPLWLIAGAVHLRGGARPPVVIPNRPHQWYRHAWGLQPHCHQACVFRVETCRALGGYDLAAGLVADFDFVLRFGLLQEPLTLSANTVLYEGGGQSARRWRELPELLHQVRVRRLGLRGSAALADACYTTLQRSKRELRGWH